MTNFADFPMIIDCFAGGGGASEGIEQALGRSPDVAINHNADALALHAANHPETLHLDSNIWDVEPSNVNKGRKIGLLWASPDCKHFSKAKGGKPKDRNIRDLAWAVVRWARLPKDQRPDVILMENVEEFRTWGPLCDEGRVIKGLEGVIFEEWMKALKDLGYKVDWKELRACDYGAPTIRKRFFMVARCDGQPIAWPKTTHGDPNCKEVHAGKLKPWRTAAECIDWSLPCPSIFDTSAEIKAKYSLTAKRPLAQNTLARVARGMKRYVLEAQKPYLVNLTHGGRVEDATAPFKTITGANRGEKAVVAPSLISVAHGDSGGRREYPLTDPLGVVTAGGVSRSLITPHLMSLKGTARRDSSVLAPHPTVLAGGGHSALVAPTLIRHFGQSVGQTATAPAPTITAGGGGKTGLIAPILTYAQHGGRNRDALDPMHTICANRKDQNAVIIPALVQTGYGEREGQKPRCLDIHAPLGTAVAGGIKHAPLSAFLAQHNKARRGFNPGRPANAPMSSVTATGSQQQIVAPWFAKYYGTGDGARTSEPCHTITVKDRFSHVQANLAPSFGPEHEARAREVAEFLRSHDAWDGGEFVTLEIEGETFVVVDIGMRMLTPRELFNAQGFPTDYVIEGVWHQDGDDWTFEDFTKSVQVSCVGNSVCPNLAEALCAANCQHLTVERIAA
ncbi:DNA cytosine methyltransferase [Shimia sp. MIT910701]|uniref:DNA cytosine methyltransferase n=1 Tax=Shimia sp. MIT910701 TaxID=3096987 RepID=UPI003999A51C